MNVAFQIHEATYEPFVSGENNVEGRFIIDNYSGVNTTFKVYFTDIVESYIKGISVRSEEGESFNTIVDNKSALLLPVRGVIRPPELRGLELQHLPPV